MTDYQLLIDLHMNTKRQGPGGDEETELALKLAKIDRSDPLKVADIGCGTGASTIVLAQHLPKAHITAVDLLAQFLVALEEKAQNLGLADKITTHAGSMAALPFDEESLDLIWSEGAIYNIGFTRGVKDWQRFLKVGGILVVSEITWITSSRPDEIQRYWAQEYDEIDLASAKMGILEQNGYAPMGYFVLPEYCWLENYYQPLQDRFEAFLNRHDHGQAARAIVAAEKQEIELYERYKSYYSYGVYIARKLN